MPIPKFVVAIATTAMQMGLQASQRIKGPRLDETKVSTADYGTPRVRFIGIRRFECPIIWTEPLREEKHTSKTKGGKYDNYRYFWSGGVEVADQVCDSIARIWMDRRLVYDTTKAGPVSIGSLFRRDPASTGPIKLARGKNMRIALGAEDQQPDPRYAAYCEDRHGPGSATAFRGKTVIHFEELPVEKFGNRVPQISAEAVTVKVASRPSETRTTTATNSTSEFYIDPVGQWLVSANSYGAIEWWDVATRARVGTSPEPGAAVGSVANTALASDGTAYQVGHKLVPNQSYLFVTSPIGVPTETELSGSASILFQCTRVLEHDGIHYAYTAYASAAGYLAGAVHVAHTQSARDFCIDEDGAHWGLFHPTGTSSDFSIVNLVNGESHTFAGTSRSGPSAAYICKVAEHGHFLVVTDGNYYIVDAAAWTLTASGAASFSAELAINNAEANPHLTSVWSFASSAFTEYSLEDASVLNSYTATDWGSVSNQHWTYDPVSHAIWMRGSGGSTVVNIAYLERIAADGVTLGDWVSLVCGWCSLTGFDASQLTQPIRGFSASPGSGKDMIEPLLTIHDVDCRMHDWTVEFVNRGSAPAGSIVTQDFARRQREKRYVVTIRQDTDLPRLVRVNFADSTADQLPNNVIAPLPADSVDSQREEAIDLSNYVATPDEAQQLADRYVRRLWNSREEIKVSLTAQHLALECADVTTLWLDELGRNARLERITQSGARLECTFIRDETGLAALNGSSGPPMDGWDEETIYVPAPTRGFVVDAPLRADSDADVRPLLYTGAAPYVAGDWPGAGLWRGDDGSHDELVELFDSTQKASWGVATAALGDVASPWLWDRGNSVNVTLQSGTLTNVSEADINADPSLNLLLVGAPGRWEYLNFTTATLEADGTYTLSGFRRGRRGTEWATGLHQAGDVWLLAAALAVEEMGSDDVGDSLSFKAQSIGRDVEAAPALAIAPFTGATLKPLAPARIKWSFDGTDLTGTIVRRTRIGGAWVGGSAIPLSENSEDYEVDVLVGGSVARTIAVPGTNVFAYTAAMAAADGITLPTRPTINAYQLSDAVGRGFALPA